MPAPSSSILNARIRERVEQWRRVAEREAEGRRHVTVPLVLAIIARESGGDETARGLAGELGLMQVIKEAWQDYRAETNDPDAATFDTLSSPDINIRVGAWVLNERLGAFPKRYDGIRAYNCGESGARNSAACGAAYADWVLNVGLPAFQRGIV